MRKQFNLGQLDGDPGIVGRPDTNGVYGNADLEFSADAENARSVGFIALIEGRLFLRECIRRSMQSAFPLRIQAFSDTGDFQRNCRLMPSLILLSALDESEDINENDFKVISEVASGVPVIVLASSNNPKMARAAIYHGAKGYIPVTLGFDLAVEAVRFVLAGGTYVPIDYLLTRNSNAPSPSASASGGVTTRELAVVRAIQQGKSNKIIAYELGMREGTVKVHVRRIMKKLNAKNRTDAAIKSQGTLSTFRTNICLETPTKEFWTPRGEPVKGDVL